MLQVWTLGCDMLLLSVSALTVSLYEIFKGFRFLVSCKWVGKQA